MKTSVMLTVIFAEYQDRIQKLFDRQASDLRQRLLESIGEAPRKAATGRKARRGRRHCGKCGSAKHDARNCNAKAVVKIPMLAAALGRGRNGKPAEKAA